MSIFLRLVHAILVINHPQEDIHAQKPDIVSGIHNSELPDSASKPGLDCGGTGRGEAPEEFAESQEIEEAPDIEEVQDAKQ